MRYAETHQLLGSILVGVCYNLDPGRRWGSRQRVRTRCSWQWDRIRAHQQWIAVYHSTDDPHIPAAEPRHVAAQLRCSYFEFADRGHFVDAHAIPQIVPFLKRKLRIEPPTNRPSRDR